MEGFNQHCSRQTIDLADNIIIRKSEQLSEIRMRGGLYPNLEKDVMKLKRYLSSNNRKICIVKYSNFSIIYLGTPKIPITFDSEEKTWFKEKLSVYENIIYWDAQSIAIFVSRKRNPKNYALFLEKIHDISNFKYDIANGTYELRIM